MVLVLLPKYTDLSIYEGLRQGSQRHPFLSVDCARDNSVRPDKKDIAESPARRETQ